MLVCPEGFGPVPLAHVQAHELDVAGLAVRVQREGFLRVAEGVVLERAPGQALCEQVEGAQQRGSQVIASPLDPQAALGRQEWPPGEVGGCGGRRYGDVAVPDAPR